MLLGWDCAHKTLAWSHVQIDIDIVKKISEIMPRFREVSDMIAFAPTINAELAAEYLAVLTRMDDILLSFIKYESAGVVDLLPGKKVKEVSEIDRTKCLSKFLRGGKIRDLAVSTQTGNTSTQTGNTSTRVIIEHQNAIGGAVPIHNMPSTIIGAQLAFYYADYEVAYIDPKLKNKLVLAPHLVIDLYISRELERRSDTRNAKYTANKKHSTDSFLHVLRLFNLTHILVGINKSVYDDVADTLMEIFADIRRNGYITA